MTDHLVATLNEPTRSKAIELVNFVRSFGIPMFVSSAKRDPVLQRAFVQAGLSNTLNSRHLVGQAFDVDIRGFARDDIPLWWWWQLGPIAERYLGLRWGGRWSSPRDFGHFEEPRA